MTEAKAVELLKAMFHEDERQFLLSHAKFKKAVRRATEESIFELSDLGTKILLH